MSARSGRFSVEAQIQKIGDDLLVSIWGGTRPHIGAVGIAVPRPSLADPSRRSATSSNYTFVGHKEDGLVREASEALAAALGRNVVVTAGIHWDGLRARDLARIEALARRLVRRIADHLQAGQPKPKKESR
jgi:gallate decarboxylase subunit D